MKSLISLTNMTHAQTHSNPEPSEGEDAQEKRLSDQPERDDGQDSNKPKNSPENATQREIEAN